MKYLLTLNLVFALILLGCSSDDMPRASGDEDNQPTLTLIPDSAFEQALIDIGVDTEINGSVPTTAIINVTELVFNNKNISSMVGLEDFTALINLWLNDNMLTELNISQNRNLQFVYAENNMLSALDVSGLGVLEKIGMNGNMISSINVAGNANLELLELVNNDVFNLDVSNNTKLTRLYIESNPLTCIKVNATQLASIPIDWVKDNEDIYSENCTQ